MNIRQKTIAVIAACVMISAALNFLVLRWTVLPSFEALEQQGAVKDIGRVVEAIQARIKTVAATTKDYSTWDDSFAFASGADDGFIEANLYASSVRNLDLDLVAIRDRTGRTLFEAVYPADGSDAVAAGDLAVAVIDPAGRLLATAETEAVAGLVLTGRGPLIVAARPILKSSGEGPAAGSLIMGRLLGDDLVEELSAATGVRFALLTADRAALDGQDAAALDALAADGGEAWIADQDAGRLAVYGLLRDVHGMPALLVHARVDRAVSRAGTNAVIAAIVGVIAAGLVVMAVMAWLLQLVLVGPIAQLSRHLLAVGQSGDLARRVALDRRDELGVLSLEFDRMLARLSEARNRLLEQSYSAGIAEMASGVLHNIRNQLAPLSLRLCRLREALGQATDSKLDRALAELKSDTVGGERRRKLLDYVALACRSATERQDAMLGDLRSVADDFQRIENVLRDLDRFSRGSGAVTAVALGELVRDTVGMLPRYPDIEVTIRIDPKLEACPRVAAEPFVLKHVIHNLLMNAIELMLAAGRARGTIALSASAQQHAGAPAVDLAIADEGVGIAADRLEAIFGRGYSTKSGPRRGTGLHWCANSMLALGGRISAESPGPGHGATLHVLIPAAVAEAKAAA